MTSLERIWNRAADNGGDGDGDLALAAVLNLHGMVMNGGLLNALETIDPEELADAKDGYRWLGLDSVADLIVQVEAEASEIPAGDLEAIDDLEVQADDDYYRIVPDDAALQEALEARYAEEPDAFDAV
ncbi:MAG TPA: hypothetical protein GX013_09410 [Propionibacterium sp.]|nr:hypothetical protein [Propionibacterium sp.]